MVYKSLIDPFESQPTIHSRIFCSEDPLTNVEKQQK